MAGSAAARDRFYRTIEPLLGAEQAEFLMDNLPPGGWDEVATKTDVREARLETSELRVEVSGLRSEMRAEFAEVRGEMSELRSEMRSAMVTKSDLAEQLRLHVDARVGAISRWWMFSCMGMQAATIAGVIAAVRL